MRILAPLLLALGLAGPVAAAEPATPERPATTLDVRVHPGFASIDERSRTAEPKPLLFVALESKAADPLVVTAVALLAPPDLEIAGAPGRLELAPGQKAVLSVAVQTRATLNPGTQPLVLQLTVELGAPGARRTDQILVVDTVDLAVPGLSDVLKLIGVPALFLLPGVLVLVAWAWIGAGLDGRLAPPDWTKLPFFVLAITISGAIAFH